MRKGLIHLYIGKGEGKTSAAVGHALRAHGAKKRVCFIQFLKPKISPEVQLLKKLKIPVLSFKEKHPLFSKPGSMANLKKKLLRNLEKAEDILKDKKYDFVILDEVLYLLKDRLISEGDILRLIKSKPRKTEFILTGGSATKAVIDLADYVSTIVNTKHPFKRGAIARKGVEF